jgi:two-component system, LuxR family, response regulator FixJ
MVRSAADVIPHALERARRAMSDHSGTVLLVDDDLAVRSSLKFVLELEGLAVRAYASGAELLADPDLPGAGVS